MTDWQKDDEYLCGPAATSLPTPTNTPYRTPSRTSRMSRHSVTPPPKGPTPPPLAVDRMERNSKRSSRDVAADETISILDPRRFTPTLHANLVSEILALRRDQEEKTKIIESLEMALTNSREEQDALRENLSNTSKESRSTKRQLALLEGGTTSALGELARERDDAVEQNSDMKKRLEAAQKRIRVQDDDSERVHDLWAQEKDGWEDERRKFERKVHVAESRLKSVLDEVAAFQAAQTNGAQHESDTESFRDTDATSVRSMSMTNSVRFSVIGPGKLNGNSLADELNFDGDDDDQTDVDGRESVLSHQSGFRHTRNFSRDSITHRMHRRNQSIDSLRRPGSVSRGKIFMNQSVLEALEGESDNETEANMPKVSYVDTGIQFSPPPSPKFYAVKPSTPEPSMSRARSPEADSSPRIDGEIEANQRRKRVQISMPLFVEPLVEPPTLPTMVSVASQTAEEPPSPPKTPPPQIEVPEMVESCTQTEIAAPPPPLAPPPPIPSISIRPPTSRPTTPRESRLPQHFKHFGCQVNFSKPVYSSDAAVQTEGIQIDRRLAKLPLHLQPSSITSRPNSPNPADSGAADENFTPVPPRNPRRVTDKPVPIRIPPSPLTSTRAVQQELRDAYPGNNDDGPLSSDKPAPIRRPHRFSSLFAGFDTASSDEADEFDEADLSDAEFHTALSAPRHAANRGSMGTPATSPEQFARREPVKNYMKLISSEVYSSTSFADKENYGTKASYGGRSYDKASASSQFGLGNRASVMRKAAMIQSGIASHNGRSRSPSLPDAKNPPFPIPTRASSRKPPFSASAPSDGPRSPTRVENWPRRGSGRNVYRSNSIRKTRSATALPRAPRSRRQGNSPPPMSPSSGVPESPGLPPLPKNDLTTPRQRRRGSSQYRHHRQQPSINTENTEPVSTASGGQSTGVVDAIAQTMIGEWMFKYVRRRKSFGVAENNNKDDSGNDRHKRWVWLAPYERAILWSSKQPATGSALMGKTGRKLVIQSVLDVKDDNPLPKGADTIFNRSILILTPQRALKFTASTAERHYVWLTALSFLAHSQQDVPDIVSPPPTMQSKQLSPPEMDAPPPPTAKGRRPGIRDSIRLAKGKNSVPSRNAMPSIPSPPSSQPGDVVIFNNFRIPESIGAISSSHTREESADTADPPFVPRFVERSTSAQVHGRKRSNTGGRVPPPLSFRGFSGPPSNHNASSSTAGASIITAGSSDIYQSQGSGTSNWGGMSQAGMSHVASQRTSEASSRPSNFFDAIGTMRMEAFISPLAQFNEYPEEPREFRQMARRRSKEMRRRRSRSRHRDSYSYTSRSGRASDDRHGGSRTAGEEDYFRDDPFRGF